MFEVNIIISIYILERCETVENLIYYLEYYSFQEENYVENNILAKSSFAHKVLCMNRVIMIVLSSSQFYCLVKLIVDDSRGKKVIISHGINYNTHSEQVCD